MNSTEGRRHAAFPGSNVKGIPTNVPSELRGGDVHHWEHLLHEQMNPTHVGGLLTNSSDWLTSCPASEDRWKHNFLHVSVSTFKTEPLFE